MVACLCCQFGARVRVFSGYLQYLFLVSNFLVFLVRFCRFQLFGFFGQILFKIWLKRIRIPGQKIDGFGVPFWGPDLVSKLGHK